MGAFDDLIPKDVPSSYNVTPPKTPLKAAPNTGAFKDLIPAAPSPLVEKYKRMAATPPLPYAVGQAGAEVLNRPGDFHITAKDIEKLLGPQLEAGGEALQALPSFIPFNAVSNAAITASEGKLHPAQLIKSIIESLPFGKAIKTAVTDGPAAVLQQQSLTEPLNLRPPRELLINAIKAIKPDFKAPQGMLPNLAMDVAGGAITGAPLVAAENALKTTGKAMARADALSALEALKNNPERISRIFAKGQAARMAAKPKMLPAPAEIGPEGPGQFRVVTPEAQAAQEQGKQQLMQKLREAFNKLPKQLPAPENLGPEGAAQFRINPREVADQQLANASRERLAFTDALRPRLKALPPPAAAGDGFERVDPAEARRRLTEQLRQHIQSGSSGPKEPLPGTPDLPSAPPKRPAKLTKFDNDEVIQARLDLFGKRSTHLINTPERAVIRDEAAKLAYGSGAKIQGRRVDFVQGIPSSGKSSVVGDALVKKHGALVIDSDHVSKYLPEYNGGKNNGILHTEAADIAEGAVLKQAVINGDNIVMPVVGKNLGKMKAMIAEMKAHGYDVHLHLVDLPVDKAAERAIQRWKETGVFVDPDYVVNHVGLKPSKNYDILKKEEGVSSYAKYSNDVERGKPAKLVESGTNVRREPGVGGQPIGEQYPKDAAVNPEASKAKPAFPSLISKQRSKEIQALEKEAKDLIDEEAVSLQRDDGGFRGGEIMRKEGFGGSTAGYTRTSLPEYMKHPETGNKPINEQQWRDLAEKNLGSGQSRYSDDYKETLAALSIARKRAAEGGFARIGKNFDGMSEDEIRKEVAARLKKALDGGKKERKFIPTVRDSKNTDPKVAAAVEGVYDPITNKQTLADANKLIETNPQEAHRLATGDDTPTALSNAVAQRLADIYQKSGRIDDAIEIIEKTAQKATAQGQAIQALSMYNRLTPEGVLAYAQRTFDKARRDITGKVAGSSKLGKARMNPDELAALPKSVQKELDKLKLTPQLSEELRGMAKAMQEATDPRDKAIKTAQLLKKIANQMPVSIWTKISFAQTLAQLLNPKTAIRNILGNVGFGALENISDVTAAAFDNAVSLVTKQRAKVLPDIKVQFKGLARGYKEGMEDLKAGVNTSASQGTKYDIPAPGIFKSSVGRAFEKMLNFELQVPDRMAYTAAFEASLNNQLRAAKATVPTEAMLEIAHHDGLYRTFQDKNAISTVFVGLKKALNGGGEFGLGDAVLKYPKTPANILARGIDYSPAGFIKTALELGKGLTGHGFNQKAFVESAARAFTGTGLVGTGIILSRLGLITGRSKESSGITELKKHIGLGDYKLNVSGLKRFVMSGFNAQEAGLRKGDILKTYDWFLPQAIDIAIGANINENRGRPVGIIGTIADSLASGTRTLAEQPLVQGLQKVAGYGDIVGGLGEVAKGIPASFTPTLLRQVGMLVDDIRRNPDNENPLQEAGNLVKIRIPGLSKQLPPKPGPFGDTVHYLKDSKTTGSKALAAFVDPAITTTYGEPAETPAAEQLIKFNVPVTKQGKSLKGIELTGEERAAVDAATGPMAKQMLMAVVQSPGYQALGDLQKQKLLETVISKTKTVAEAATVPQIARRLVQQGAAK